MKRLMDLFISGAGLLAFLPVGLVIGVLLRFSGEVETQLNASKLPSKLSATALQVQGEGPEEDRQKRNHDHKIGCPSTKPEDAAYYPDRRHAQVDQRNSRVSAAYLYHPLVQMRPMGREHIFALEGSPEQRKYAVENKRPDEECRHERQAIHFR